MSEVASDSGSMWAFIFGGNWVALGILLLLMVMSAVSWAIIIVKWLQLRQVRAENAYFLAYFRGEHPLAEIAAMARKLPASSLARMFLEGNQEIASFRQAMEKSTNPSDARERLLNSLSRRLESVYNQQSELLEARLPLATSPDLNQSSPTISARREIQMSEVASDSGSMWAFIFGGNWVALGILLLLMVMSAVSWAIIIVKWLQLRQVRAENAYFLAYFRGEHPLAEIAAMARKLPASSLARMFLEGNQEIASFRQAMEKSTNPSDARERLLNSLSRRLESVYNQQSELLEARLPHLAVVSGSAPYIGLFGTVLGIIDSFRSIATMGVTSLAVVAPGISEALVATAAGLMAAIPALIAYNMFRNRLREITTHMKNFALDVTNRLERLL